MALTFHRREAHRERGREGGKVNSIAVSVNGFLAPSRSKGLKMGWKGTEGRKKERGRKEENG